MKLFVILGLFLLGVCLYPLALIWALNFIFHLNIAYSFLSVLAVGLLCSIFSFRMKFNSGAK